MSWWNLSLEVNLIVTATHAHCKKGWIKQFLDFSLRISLWFFSLFPEDIYFRVFIIISRVTYFRTITFLIQSWWETIKNVIFVIMILKSMKLLFLWIKINFMITISVYNELHQYPKSSSLQTWWGNVSTALLHSPPLLWAITPLWQFLKYSWFSTSLGSLLHSFVVTFWKMTSSFDLF